MSSQALTFPDPGQPQGYESVSEERRAGCDRRSSDRRSVIRPFQTRESRLRFAAQAAGFGIYDLDCLTGDSVWSPELREMAGLPPNDAPLSMEEAIALIHPEDRQRVLEKFQASLQPEGGGDFEEEHRLLRPDGSIRWVRTKGRSFFGGAGPTGRCLAATGVVMDITLSRTAEHDLAESREELSKLVDSAIDAIITVDAEQRIVRFNPAASRMFHCPAEEAIGSRLDRFIPERFRATHNQHVENFAQGGITGRTMGKPGVFAGLRADGEEFPIEASIVKVQVDGRRRMTVFLRDITDRVKAEQALRRSKEDLELAVRGADIGIWNWDQRADRFELSERCHQLFGISPGKPLRFADIAAAIHPDDRKRVEDAFLHAQAPGREYKVDKRFVWPDGSIHWVECIGRDLYDQDSGQAVGIRGISLDIAERKRSEEDLRGWNEELERRIQERTAELTQANEALERSNLELQQFAFIAAHDLQTPLRSISSFAELLQNDYRGRFDAQADAWLDQLMRSTRRMHDVVQDLLAYSRVESRGNPFQPTDFNQLFDEVLATHELSIQETGAQVTRDDLPTVMGDRVQLAQVLQNLIDNAIKYHGTEPPRIHVSARREDGAWVLSVRDNGIGIADKHLDNIFEIFRRLHTEQDYPGTGIGLAICRRVIRRHGGKIWAESEPGKGSVFHLLLPDRK